MKKAILFLLLLSSTTSTAKTEKTLLDSAENFRVNKEYTKAVEYAKKYLRENPLGRHPGVHFDLARYYSLQGNTEAAVLELQSSIHAGFTGYALLLNHPDLTELRQSAYWTYLLTQFQNAYHNHAFFYWGIYAGILFIILVYNLMLYLSTKDFTFVYSALILLFSWHYEMFRNEEFGLFMFSNLTGWSYCSSLINPVNFFISLAALSLTFYLQSLLRLRELLPVLHKLLNVLAVLFTLFALLSGFSKIEVNALIFLSISLTLIFYFVVGIVSWSKGYRPARFFVIADIVFIICVLSILFNYFGIVDSVLEVGQFKARHIGLITFFGLITLATGDKIITLQKEKELAQEKALEVLEQKVKERTSEVVQQKQLVEEKQKEILESISYAKRLQEAILPPEELISKEIPDNFILYMPKDLVAGDFYWAEKINDVFLIAAADSTGHGVPGAMVSVVCSNALNRAVKEFKLSDPGKILDKTRELVVETFVRTDSSGEKSYSEVKDGMDISLLAIDKTNKKVLWSGANNPLWYLDETGVLQELKADKQAIGKTDHTKNFTTHSINYSEGSVFYLFTDGFADQFGGPKGKKFKYKPMFDLLQTICQNPIAEQSKSIVSTFFKWKGELEQ
ncbi:MAG: SpoIIE family protein phosphatase, partial [Bacteroidia bacterium]|nr:SpoIIE family protein phosphatase [Bacteroidia bacterium]